jgi:hypothetical protein
MILGSDGEVGWSEEERGGARRSEEERGEEGLGEGGCRGAGADGRGNIRKGLLKSRREGAYGGAKRQGGRETNSVHRKYT